MATRDWWSDPAETPEPSGRSLSLEERLQIADLYLGGAGVRAIVVAVGRSPATVSRELRRNGSAPTARRAGKYAPYAAQKQAELRGRRPKASKFDYAELASLVQSRLCVKWSPEQISLHLAERFPSGRRCGCVPRRFTRPCTSKAAVICVLTCTDTCGPAVPSGESLRVTASAVKPLFSSLVEFYDHVATVTGSEGSRFLVPGGRW